MGLWVQAVPPVPCRVAEELSWRADRPPSPAPGVPGWPEFSCCLPTELECTLLLRHSASNCGTFTRRWGMLGLAERREWMLGDKHGLHICSGVVYSCRSATTGLHSPSCPWGRPDAQRMGSCPEVFPHQCPGPAERVTGVGLCHELFQTFALGKGPFSISIFVRPEMERAPQHAPLPPLPASCPHLSILPVKPLMPSGVQGACPGFLGT